jgi:hypothetical protein
MMDATTAALALCWGRKPNAPGMMTLADFHDDSLRTLGHTLRRAGVKYGERPGYTAEPGSLENAAIRAVRRAMDLVQCGEVE